MSEHPDADSISVSQYFNHLPARFKCSCLTVFPTVTKKLTQRTRVFLMAPNTVLKNKIVNSILKHIKVFKTSAAEI